jgi:DNA-binding transcriptional ArsR family regulator
MKVNQVSRVQRLIQSGVCRPEDIAEARAEAERLSTPETAEKIRRTERLLGAVGEPTRIKIIMLLSRREMCVCELEAALGLAQPTMSHHLGVLERVNLLERRKSEKWVFYRLRESPVTELVKKMMA